MPAAPKQKVLFSEHILSRNNPEYMEIVCLQPDKNRYYFTIPFQISIRVRIGEINFNVRIITYPERSFFIGICYVTASPQREAHEERQDKNITSDDPKRFCNFHINLLEYTYKSVVGQAFLQVLNSVPQW
jgi:hypothetical protein